MRVFSRFWALSVAVCAARGQRWPCGRVQQAGTGIPQWVVSTSREAEGRAPGLRRQGGVQAGPAWV